VVRLLSSQTRRAAPGRCVIDHGFDKKGPYSPPLACLAMGGTVI
jgi:hypothetical protein